jgi:hypothetical protein
VGKSLEISIEYLLHIEIFFEKNMESIGKQRLTGSEKKVKNTAK